MAQHLLDLQQRLAELQAAILETLEGDGDGQHLQTLPGVGPVIAATIRAELGDIARFAGVDQVVAYAGLDPRTRQSGAFVGQTHLSKRGPGALRHALDLAALNAVRNRAEWRERYQRLLDRGRAKKEALTILSRALLRVAYHVLRTHTAYDPDCLKPSPGTAGSPVMNSFVLWCVGLAAVRRPVSRLFLLLATGVALIFTPAHAQVPAALQPLFLGDRVCGDDPYDCAFPGVSAAHRYLHVVLHDLAGNADWQVQTAPTCDQPLTTVAGGQPVAEGGYLEVVIDLQTITPSASAQPTCFVFRGRNGYEITYYAAYLDDQAAPDAESVYPGYESLSGRPDLGDLDVTYIHRTPTFAYDAHPNTPQQGQIVTFQAHLLNAGGLLVAPFSYVWSLDQHVVATGEVTAPLLPGAQLTIPFTWRWDAAPHTLTFQALVTTPQISTTNDQLTIRTDALSLGIWVEQSAYTYFRDHQWEYCQGWACAGSDSFEDWLQRQVSAWNTLLASTVYPGISPAGIADRIRLDELTIVPDGTLPLAGGLPTNDPDNRDHTVDLAWGMPAHGIQGEFPSGADNAFDIDWATIHELNHARSLADLYRFDIPITGHNSIAVTGLKGQPIYNQTDPYDPASAIHPFATWRNEVFIYQDKDHDLMACPCTPYYSPYDAMLLDRLRGRRARCGNTNPPCNLGDWYADVPSSSRIRILDRAGLPVPDGTTVHLFYDTATTYNTHAFDVTHVDARHVVHGAIQLGHDPFHTGGSRYLAGHNLLLIEVQAPGDDMFCFQEPTDFNEAFWFGYRTAQRPALFTLRLGHQILNGCNLTLPTAIVNEPFATSPDRSQVSLGARYRVAGRRYRTLTIHLVDDAVPANPMRHRLLQVRGLAGRLLAQGRTDSSGTAWFILPGAVPSVQVIDATDNHLLIIGSPQARSPAAVPRR